MEIKKYILDQGKIYWPRNSQIIMDLPIPQAPISSLLSPISSLRFPVPNFAEVNLPSWAREIGVQGELLLPVESILPGTDPVWKRTDWYLAAFWYLSGLPEYRFEIDHGPIHSHAYRLKNWDDRIWERAWVNRIFLFLRRWAARTLQTDEGILFGILPQAEIVLTHDVDGVSKTLPMRLKRTAFYVFNALRCALQKEPAFALEKLKKVCIHLFSRDDYWCFDQIQETEERFGQRSIFYFYGGNTGNRGLKTGQGGWGTESMVSCLWSSNRLKKWLFDPSYDVHSKKLRAKIQELSARGWEIGLHLSFDAWKDSAKMREEKERLEQALGAKVTVCRQHWLRFSWECTWRSQEQAGFKRDMTLGFNNRPGFRSGAALEYHPWDFKRNKARNIVVLPTIFMDSHFYDYEPINNAARKKRLTYWVDEIKEVHGRGALIWHQRVFGGDYGWDKGYNVLINMVGHPGKPFKDLSRHESLLATEKVGFPSIGRQLLQRLYVNAMLQEIMGIFMARYIRKVNTTNCN